jgi:hypothetical protein
MKVSGFLLVRSLTKSFIFLYLYTMSKVNFTMM